MSLAGTRLTVCCCLFLVCFIRHMLAAAVQPRSVHLQHLFVCTFHSDHVFLQSERQRVSCSCEVLLALMRRRDTRYRCEELAGLVFVQPFYLFLCQTLAGTAARPSTTGSLFIHKIRHETAAFLVAVGDCEVFGGEVFIQSPFQLEYLIACHRLEQSFGKCSLGNK